jgi:hypothetical protein
MIRSTRTVAHAGEVEMLELQMSDDRPASGTPFSMWWTSWAWRRLQTSDVSCKMFERSASLRKGSSPSKTRHRIPNR